MAHYLYALALAYQHPPRVDDALSSVERALELNPQLAQAYLLRCWLREMKPV